MTRPNMSVARVLGFPPASDPVGSRVAIPLPSRCLRPTSRLDFRRGRGHDAERARALGILIPPMLSTPRILAEHDHGA